MNYFVSYQIGSIRFASPIKEIGEIVRIKQINTVGKLPKYIAGFFELRGKKIWLFDLPVFLNVETHQNFEIILTEMTNINIGLKVEKVLGIVNADKIFPYPDIVHQKDFLTGVIKNGKDILQVISFFRLLSGQRLKAIQKLQ